MLVYLYLINAHGPVIHFFTPSAGRQMIIFETKPSNPLSNSTAPEVASHPPPWCFSFHGLGGVERLMLQTIAGIGSVNASKTNPSKCLFFLSPPPPKKKSLFF